ncbi:MAG: type II secretion system F family protein [Candidatus Nanohaloarchaea archaeon]|nr:type II secretion system F family protein [Candidatus Nanohaloarchaea archaeon]
MSNEDDQHAAERPSTFQQVLEADTFAGLSNTLFGRIVDKYPEQFRELRDYLEQSDTNVLFRTYVSQMFLASILVFVAVFFAVLTSVLIIRPHPLLSVVLVISAPGFVASMFFVFLYIYPEQVAKSRATNINRNLPFALNQMSAVASSGIPPSSMFKLLTNFEEYEEISKEAEKIVTKIEVFGEDLTTALREVASETPSDDLQEVLYGMISTIETGGNLNEFLQEQAESALFDYRMRRKEQIQNLSTYASFYTAILVAAPLFLIAILAVMNMVGGSLLGFQIDQIMRLGVYVLIPLINIAFILMLTLTQEEL